MHSTWFRRIFFAVSVAGASLFPLQFLYAQTTPIPIKTLVILANFPDDKITAETQAQMQATYFGATNSISSYYYANSNGKILIQGDVTPYLTLGITLAVTTTVVNGVTYQKSGPGADYDWIPYANAAATAAGYDLTKYAYIHYIWPTNACPGLTDWSNNRGVPGTYPQPGPKPYTSSICTYHQLSAAAHEFGHNLGFSHADSIPPAPSPYTGYGDFSDVMGDNWASPTPLESNGPHKFYAGWTAPGGVQTLTPGTQGTFTINSLEGNSGLQILTFAKPDTAQTYYVSMRDAIGANANIVKAGSFIAGANIHIDSTSNTNTYLAKVLSDGVTWTDAINGITIKQLSHTNGSTALGTIGSATLQVTIPITSCQFKAPSLAVNPPAPSAPAGAAVNFLITVTNNDDPATCKPSSFTLTPGIGASGLPTGWTSTLLPSSLTIAPGQSGTFVFTLTSPPTQGVGGLGIGYTIKDALGVGVHTQTGSFIENISALPPKTCTLNPPVLVATPTAINSTPGTAQTYNLTITNKDTATCPTASWVFSSNIPAGWSGMFSTNIFGQTTTGTNISVALAGGFTTLHSGYENVTFTATSPSNATGVLPIAITATDPVNPPTHSNSTTVTYSLGPATCTPANPTLTATPASSTIPAGTPKAYTIGITNKDSVSCPSTTFLISTSSASSLNSWTTSFGGLTTAPNQLLLGAGTNGSITLNLTSPTGASNGTTTVTLSAIDKTNGTHATSIPVDYGIPLIPPACVRTAPLVSLSQTSPPAPTAPTAGSSITYTVNITNTDSVTCPSTSFTLSGTVPAGWPAGSISPITPLPISPGLPGLATYTVTSPSGATPNPYPVSVSTVADPLIPAHTAASGSATYTIGQTTGTPPPDTSTMSISTTKIRKGDPATVSWWVSSGLATGVSCTVSPTSAFPGGTTLSMAGSGSVTSWGSATTPITAVTNNINALTTFTLTCSNGASAPAVKTATIKFLPTPQEI